jgi:predicted TIM-barrel fold metal-dependent hydrolase
MLITDAQVHIWGADTPERPWPKRAEPQRPIPLGADDLLREMNEAGVDRVVLVPPSWEGDRNDLAIAAAKAHPDRFAIMGRFDPDAPGAKSQVAGWRKQPGMLGMRFTFHTPVLLPILTGGSMDWLWAEAEKAGVRMMILVPHAYVPMIDDVAARYPGLSITMDHLSLTSHKYDAENFDTIDALLALAKRPNVAVKASALPCYTKDTYPFRKLEPHIRRVYDAFGPKRMFWGTDLSRSPIPYRQHVTWWMDEMPWLSAQDKEWIMGRGICEWLGWKLPS